MPLLSDQALAGRILDLIDSGTTDCGEAVWREPVENYLSPARYEAELALMRRTFTAFCPSAALAGPGAYVARVAAGTPLVAVRGKDGEARVFRNSCRHRGVPVAEGIGQTSTFVCPYHAWTYGLDGALRGVPEAYGFPCLDKAEHGLVPVASVERHGLVFVRQEGDQPFDESLEALDGLIGPKFRFLSVWERRIAANWKLIAEGFLEGYHIMATHSDTFYPVQYHNLNAIEAFGPNNRVSFPYKRIEKQRNAPRETWTCKGAVTSVHHLFPNVMISPFPATTKVSILEPVDISTTRQLNYVLTELPDDEESRAFTDQGMDLVMRGFEQDVAMTEGAQKGLAARANDHMTFGLFEHALARLHAELGQRLT
jgi:phenylpropionate dioxygenase-like ring-hydroxylating dioxygenase large terminal subunit